MATYIKPNAIKDASIEGIKIKDGTISSSKIDGTVASKSYVDTELDRCAKRDEANTFIQNQIFTNGITFNRMSSGGPRFIDIDNKTIRATLYGSNDSCANIEAAPGGPDTSFNSVLTVMSLSYPLKIGGAWTFSSYPTVPGVNIGSSISLYTSETEKTPYIGFYARTGYSGLAINGISKVLNDNTSITNKEYVDTQVKLANNAVQITYSELKSLRDAGKLVPGTQYRITDYTCTTTQANTKSAGHPFDIIVTADDASTLNEVARAVKHEGDTYFANSDLSAWKIWYCLDNDANRFAWADATNGKGVIYRMIDEWNNDCPYDFKNIQFYRKWSSSKSLWGIISSDSTSVPCYTFSSSGDSATTSFTDMSLLASNGIYSNVIGKYVSSNKQTLNNNCFFGNNCSRNTFGNNCSSNTFGNNCSSNTFGDDCFSNTFGNDFQDNTFGNGCYNNTFGNKCSRNTFVNSCSRNTFGNSCSRNTFGNSFQANTFGNHCDSNTFGNDCYENTFGDDCFSNTFGNDFQDNTFGNGCYNNTFGNKCSRNTFVNSCYNNTFGNNCFRNTFGYNCWNNTFGNSFQANTFGNIFQESQFGDGVQYFSITTQQMATSPTSSYVKSYIRWLIVENGVRYVNAYVTGSTSSSSYCQNVRICLGIQGVNSDDRKTFDITSCINSKVNNIYQPTNSQTTSV